MQMESKRLQVSLHQFTKLVGTQKLQPQQSLVHSSQINDFLANLALAIICLNPVILHLSKFKKKKKKNWLHNSTNA